MDKTPKQVFQEAVEQTQIKMKIDKLLVEKERETSRKEFWKFVEVEEAGE